MLSKPLDGPLFLQCFIFQRGFIGENKNLILCDVGSSAKLTTNKRKFVSFVKWSKYYSYYTADSVAFPVSTLNHSMRMCWGMDGPYLCVINTSNNIVMVIITTDISMNNINLWKTPHLGLSGSTQRRQAVQTRLQWEMEVSIFIAIILLLIIITIIITIIIIIIAFEIFFPHNKSWSPQGTSTAPPRTLPPARIFWLAHTPSLMRSTHPHRCLFTCGGVQPKNIV